MSHVETIAHVPDTDVTLIVAQCKAEGAETVTVIPEGGGLSTIVVTWPDVPLSKPAATAAASGADAKPAAADGGEATSMKAIADRLGCDVAAVKAVCAVESSGAYFWTINGEKKPPVRLEAHLFSKHTNELVI